MDVVVLPTPPFWLAIAMILPIYITSVGGWKGFFYAFYTIAQIMFHVKQYSIDGA